MKRIIPYLLLFGLLYGAWWYWQQRPKPPLKARILPYEMAAINRVFLWPKGKEEGSFELSRVDDNEWVAENERRSITGQNEQVQQLLATLLAIESQGLVTDERLLGKTLLRLRLDIGSTAFSQENTAAIRSEELVFYAAPDTFPDDSYLLRVNDLADVYRIEEFPLQELATSFDDYRNHLLLDLNDLPRIDSVSWWRASDSTRLLLMDRSTADSSLLDSVYTAWSPRLENDFADYFGEIRDQNSLLGIYLFFGPTPTDSISVALYENESWPKPYVAKGNGKEYFAIEAPLWPINREVIEED